ncbi:LolA family protein [Actinacidiphila acididurans]|uniref:DUF2092 domain-containing protein n=1 Tax=Actinacidiphila acididurans TaxID=2784346 RepID=A0ABS2TND3_9ACTN|nr:DUF2092 domain-containing protein [Actinacidiphila acididurans]MBM9504854.1 DUF2092 domain-containing protein [Actinacidiphila acididurans]
MAPIQPAQYDPQWDDGGGEGRSRGRKVARFAVPVAVAGVAAATIGLVPALADAGDPSLPSLTAEQLLTKIAASHVQTVSGSVKVTTDLGLPSALSSGAASSLFGGGAGASAKAPGTGAGSPAAPQTQLTQLLAGTHTLHVAADGPDRQKVSVIEPAAEYSIVHNGTQVWAYDSASNQAYHQTLPQRQSGATAHSDPQDLPATPQDAAKQVIKAADGTASFTVDGTARVAGHSAYELLIRPEHAPDTTVGAIRIAVDAKTGVPLKLTVDPRGGGKAVFDIGYTKVSFAKPAASTFDFTPGKGVKVTEGTDQAPKNTPDRAGTQPDVLGSGWDAIAVVKSADGLPTGKQRNDSGRADSLLNSFGKQVSGSFGTGTLFHTRLVNALLTDNGTLYVGAVSESALTGAADAAHTAGK